MWPDLKSAMVAVVGVIVIAMTSAPLGAQDVQPAKASVTVDYVGVEGIYLGVGAEQGVSEGDTVSIFAGATDAEPMGRLVFTSVTRRRSVARALESTRTIGRGDVLFMLLVAPPVTAEPDRTIREGIPSGRVAQGGLRGARVVSGAAGPRVSGRFSLDFEARETRTSWTGDLSGETRRRFATPTTRLSLQINNLPGGWTLRTNLRGSYRYNELGVGPPPTTIRAYEVAAIKSFDAVPLELRLGRFRNPYESYSAYWDGVLLRLGGVRGPGVGVVAGFEPTRYNEGVSSDLPKLTGFADYSVRGRKWRYDTDVSVHLLRPTDIPDRTYAGWSQRLSVGPLTLSQRLRMDRDADGSTWSVRQLRVRGSVAVGGPLRLRAAYGRSRPGAFRTTDIFIGPERREVSLGVGLLGRFGSVSIDGGRTSWEGDDDGFSLSGNAAVRLGHVMVLLSGRHWQRTEMESLGISPGVGFDIGQLRARIGYRFYRTEGGFGPVTSHAADAQLSTALSPKLRVTLRGQQQWGTNLVGTRIYFGIWRSF